MDIYLLIATVSLLVQVIVLVLLITGYVLKRKTKFRQHGLLMFSAVAFHAILVFAVMVPSFSVITFTPTGLSLMIILSVVIHAVFGITALALGIWIVASWRLRKSIQYCAPKKLFMRTTFIAWIIAITIGIILYFSLYMPLMI
jgi:uncharacterized membrane protein YozB (DUF420 family)